MNATLLALLQTHLQSYGWSPILWFWVIFGAILVIGFFALAFRRPRFPDIRGPTVHDGDRDEHLHRTDREVFP